ncbi:hypothetical protein C6P40_004473 [Pichia californica]|uniref:Uncharacterized protein n=1 Tax=Pichia californica TaxID=460514 RepID=A0A9P7BC09_9ASCO|nr:hypothetical protein C6P40_004473 [[Candida] californica]
MQRIHRTRKWQNFGTPVSSNAVVTYIYKYMNKGSDTELLSLENSDIDENNEKLIEQIRTQYMSGIKGAHLSLVKKLSGTYPPVRILHVHDEKGFSTVYKTNLETKESIKEKQQNNKNTSTLFAFFRLNKRIELYLHNKNQTINNNELLEYKKIYDEHLYKNFENLDESLLQNGIFYRDINK